MNIEVPFGGFLVSLIKELMNILKQKLKDNFIRIQKKKKDPNSGQSKCKMSAAPWRRRMEESGKRSQVILSCHGDQTHGRQVATCWRPRSFRERKWKPKMLRGEKCEGKHA